LVNPFRNYFGYYSEPQYLRKGLRLAVLKVLVYFGEGALGGGKIGLGPELKVWGRQNFPFFKGQFYLGILGSLKTFLGIFPLEGKPPRKGFSIGWGQFLAKKGPCGWKGGLFKRGRGLWVGRKGFTNLPTQGWGLKGWGKNWLILLNF